MDKNKMIIIGVVAAAVLGGVLYMGMANTPPATSPESKVEIDISPMEKKITPEEGTTGASMIEGSSRSAGAVMEEKTVSVALDAKPFSFSQKEIRVKKGDMVKIQLTNREGFHDWVVDEFKARTKQIAVGQTDTIEFIADKTGTFEYYCSVGQHRANGMVGKLIVE